jgi:PAS domain S-box-containing protein
LSVLRITPQGKRLDDRRREAENPCGGAAAAPRIHSKPFKWARQYRVSVLHGSREKQKSALDRVTRLYDALRHVNRAIVRTRNREDLFREVCRAAVEHGGFLSAFVGWHDAESKRIMPVASWGNADAYLATILIYSDERPEGSGPGGLAFRADQPYICNDFLRDPATKPWWEEARRRGIKAAAVFPIRMQSRIRGIFTVYAEQREYFQPAEIELLEETAADISFALDLFARDDQRLHDEEAIRRYADIVEFAHDAIVSTALDGTITSWNPAAERMFGYSATEMIGSHVWVLIPPDLVRERTETLARISGGERMVNFETIRVRKNGQHFPATITMSPIMSSAGICIGASKIVRDVTDSKKAEAAVRETQAQIRAVVENLDDGILIFDTERNLLQLNPAARRMIGLDAAADVPQRVEDLFEHYEVSTLEGAKLTNDQRPLWRITLGEHLHDIEMRVRPLGSQVESIFSFSGTAVQEAPGKALAFVTIKDVTEQRHAEQALRLSEARLRNAQRIAKLGSWDWYLADDRMHWSDELFDIFEIPNGEFDGTYASYLLKVHPLDREATESAMRAALTGDVPIDIEQRVLMPDGSEKYLHVRGDVQRDNRGLATSLSGTAMDISARRRAAEALREANARLEFRVRERTEEFAAAKERAESADRLKSAFLATMSHELRTPLNAIIGFTGMVLQEMVGPLNPEQSKQLAIVQSSARHLLSLINDVLDISKIEAGEMAIHLQAFNLGAMVADVVAIVEPMARKKGLNLRLESTDSPVTVISDRRRVEQVLLNLLNNAVKFTEHGDVQLSVDILDACVLPPAFAPQACARFRVTDTGIGIASADLPNLFEPFRQIHNDSTRRYEGTGLGLHICRRLADLLGGDINVESRPDIGSTFTFIIPQRRPA